MIFKKSNNTVFNFDNVEIEIVKNFIYLGIIHMYLALVALFPKHNLHCLVTHLRLFFKWTNIFINLLLFLYNIDYIFLKS